MKEFFPFLVQAIVMGVDEFLCHRRRALSRWERIGHPMDTLFFISCLAWLLVVEPSTANLWIYSGLAVWSSVFVTKDEWQHTQLCSGLENWLHSLLFIFHPVLLIWAAWLWWQHDPVFIPVVSCAFVLGGLFGLYQALFWNVWRHDQQ